MVPTGGQGTEHWRAPPEGSIMARAHARTIGIDQAVDGAIGHDWRADMEDRRFDTLARAFASGSNRRAMLKGLLGLGVAATAGAAMGSGSAEAARRTTPTPTPPACPGNQHWDGAACVCPDDNTICGPTCCPNGQSVCCDGACCAGECYSEELCCPRGSSVCHGAACCNPAEVCLEDGSCCTPKTCASE